LLRSHLTPELALENLSCSSQNLSGKAWKRRKTAVGWVQTPENWGRRGETGRQQEESMVRKREEGTAMSGSKEWSVCTRSLW
jgi:hypothetical protein